MSITAALEDATPNTAATHLPYAQDISGCLAETIGPSGLSRTEMNKALAAAQQALARLREEYHAGQAPVLSIVHRTDDLVQIRLAAQKFAAGASDIVLFGIGGSALAPRTLYQLSRFLRGGDQTNPAFHVMDNPETPWMERFISRLNLEGLRFLVVSKSGSTAETLMQCLWAIDYLQVHGLGSSLAQRMLIITEPGEPRDNPLLRIAGLHGIPVLDHPPDIGGRFAPFSIVGMLPASLLGLDTARLRAAAANMLNLALSENTPARDNPPLMGAALHAGFLNAGQLKAVIMMPYTSQLTLFTAWWRQLWAESLGKQGKGPLPVSATGPLDQHSQLQLFLDGPNDKLFTIVMPKTAGLGYRAPAVLARDEDERLNCLGGHTIGDLTDCEQRATVESLMRKGRPVRTFHIRGLNEDLLGALFMHFMLETILTGYILDIDPYDQPAVEFSKQITRALLRKLPVPQL